MLLIKKIKNFLTKADFDFDSEDVNLFNFHPHLRVFLAAIGIFYNNAESKIRLIWPAICISLLTVAVGFEIIFVRHGLDILDYSFATECFCYLVLLGIIPFVYIAMLTNRIKILQLLEDMNEDFIFICSLGSKYRRKFLEGQILIFKLCYAWMIFGVSIGIVFICGTCGLLLWYSLFTTLDEHSVRPLIFPMWLPEDDPYRTPNYEVFLNLQISFCCIFIQTFCVYVYFKFHVLLHYYYVMEIIIMDFEVIYDGLDETVVRLPRSDPRRAEVQRILNERVKRIVSWHISTFNAVKTVSSVYGPPLVYQVMFTSIAMCLMAYQIADKLDQGKLDMLFTMLLTATVIQLWIPCYLGTMLRNRGFAVGDACWSSGWHKTPLGVLLRTDMTIVILRSQQPVVIKFTGLPHLQLETFSSIISTAYSYFNMLRQYNTE